VADFLDNALLGFGGGLIALRVLGKTGNAEGEQSDEEGKAVFHTKPPCGRIPWGVGKVYSDWMAAFEWGWKRIAMEFGLCARLDGHEIPSRFQFRAGSSLRLKNRYAHDRATYDFSARSR
jgi:hypothetical protein